MLLSSACQVAFAHAKKLEANKLPARFLPHFIGLNLAQSYVFDFAVPIVPSTPTDFSRLDIVCLKENRFRKLSCEPKENINQTVVSLWLMSDRRHVWHFSLGPIWNFS